MVVKKYFTWVEMVGANGFKAHIKPTVDNNWPSDLFSVEELGYGFVDSDRRRLGIASYNQAAMTAVTGEGDTLLDRLKAETAHFGVRIVTPAKAVALCNEWYPVKPEHVGDFPDGYYSLDDDGFSIKNLTPQEVL